MGTLLEMNRQYPQTQIWIDSVLPSEVEFALANGSRGITSAPSITAYAVRNDREWWLDTARRIYAIHPEYSDRKLLWACMYEAVQRVAPHLDSLFRPDQFGMDGHLAIQANIYDFNNAEKAVRHAEKIHSLGPNYIIKIPTTAAGLRAMEEVVSGGNSVLATSCASVAQVIAAGETLERAYSRYLANGGKDGGLCLSLAMQLGWQDMCIANYAAEHGIALSDDAKHLAAIAVAKKSYRILHERFPHVRFMLSNFKTDDHIRHFIGGDLILTLPFAAQQKLDGWAMPENRIDEAVPQAVIDELLEKIPFYAQSYMEDGMEAAQFSSSIPFCRIVNDFLTPYEETIRIIRDVMIPNRYGNALPVSY